MAERVTTEEQFERIISLLPRAARNGGARLAELTELYRIPARQILRDLEEVTARAYYHPAGSADDLQIMVDTQSVTVWTKGEFHRPTRLSAREALALGIGLRVLAAEADSEKRGQLLAFAERLERELAVAPIDEMLAHYGVESGATTDGLHEFLRDVARDRVRCMIEYLKPGISAPEERLVCPYVLVYAEGAWYLLAHCCTREAVRAFRLDRILRARRAEGGFEVPEDFDPREYIGNGRVYRAGEEIEVSIRYSPRIARWILEREPVTPESDGSVVVRHRVADPQWVVRHVLQYGRDAEVLEPANIRDLVAAAAARCS